MAIYLFIFLISFLLLVKAGSSLVRSLTRLARILHVSEFMIAFMIMSFATSVPELFIGLSSAVNNIPSFSFGNILGANLINVTLVVGLAAVLSGNLEIRSKIKHKNFYIIFFLAFLPIFLGFDGVISRMEGLLMILFFAIYMAMLAREREYFSRVINEVEFNSDMVSRTLKNLARFFAGIVLLIISSALIVWSGKIIADWFGVSALVFGLIFIAVGTTLPEISFAVRSSILKHGSMAIGNSMGSIAFNSALIIGIVSLVNPIKIENGHTFFLTSAFLLVSFILFNIFVYTKSNILRKEGAALIALYIFFILLEYFL